jgi:bifunctional non-homologous end joining protein LigD
VPAQPVERDKPPVGTNWVHEIKHDGYRLLVHRDGAEVVLFSRNGSNLSEQFPAIVAAALRLNAQRFLIDGEAVVLGPDGLSRSTNCAGVRAVGPRSFTRLICWS